MDRLPSEFIADMRSLLGEEYEDYLASFDKKIDSSIRLNTQKISVEDFRKISPFSLEPIPWTSDGFYVGEDDGPSKHPYYHAGLYYIQEASAMAPGEILDIEEGDRVLDACAAPGGKSTKILSKLKGTGVLLSNDISPSRAQALLKNLERYGGDNFYVMSEDPEHFKEELSGYFDKILLDAPCNGEGMFHKDPSLISSWEKRGNLYYQPVQKKLLLTCLDLLKPGGRLLYSTCTFSPLENEEVIRYALDNRDDISLVDIEKKYGFQEGVNGLKECARLYPHKLRGEGHFLALIEKMGERLPNEEAKIKSTLPEALRDVRNAFADSVIMKRDERYFAIRNTLPIQKKYRILRSGCLLGEETKYGFEYSEALALTLRKHEYPYVLDLSVDDERVLRYLRGETLSVKEEGLRGKTVLVLVDGFPLGFGKEDNGRLKNRYPKQWRIV